MGKQYLDRTGVRYGRLIAIARNTSANRYLQYKGKSKTIAEWIEISNINGNTFRARLRYGWSIEKILTTPVSS